eukprot:1376105-Pyramimonas_sp.AAC.1
MCLKSVVGVSTSPHVSSQVPPFAVNLVTVVSRVCRAHFHFVSGRANVPRNSWTTNGPPMSPPSPVFRVTSPSRVSRVIVLSLKR